MNGGRASVEDAAKKSVKNQFDLTQNQGECEVCGSEIQKSRISFRRELPEKHDYDYHETEEVVYTCAQPKYERHLSRQGQRQVAEAKLEDELISILDSDDLLPFDD